MSRLPGPFRSALVGTGVALALAACSAPPHEPVPAPPAASERAPASLSDADGDGFVNQAEAEGYHRSHFGQLDGDHDGLLSSAELEPADQGLVGATEQGFVDRNMLQYGQRADPGIGMMSTEDFDELFGLSDPDLTR
jgi:hypothetical protein